MATKIKTPELFNLSSNNTAATQLPVFTTSTRPTPTASTIQVEYLLVAGGGGGGAGYTASTVGTGGGGGAGGLITNYGGTSLSLNTSTAYTITVGDGGNGGAPGGNSFNGGDSTFSGTGITTIQAAGGGRGGMYNNSNIGGSGGSGGGTGYSGGFAAGGSGNTPSTTPSQGNDGGDYYEVSPYGGGGGGGAGSAGSDGPTNVDGGSGVTNSITGTSVFYAAGGGGGKPGTSGTQAGGSGIGGDGGNANSLNGTSGATNTGSGGGGAGHPFASSSNSGTAGDGGSGIVILRYPTNSSPVIKTTGSLVYTESIDSSDTVIQFTEGSGNVSFASAGITVGEMIFNSTTEKVEYWDGFQWNMIKDEEQIDPTKDLILYLDANDPASGISNTSWVDVSANNYSLTSNGTPVLGGTSPQKEYDIAIGDYFGLPNTAPPFGNTNGVIAVECWVKLKANNSRAYWFSTSSTTNKNDYFYIGWLADLGNVYIAYRNGTTSDEYFELGALSGNTSWQHIFCQLNGSTKEIWINGVQQSTTPSGTGPSSGWVDYVSYATAASTNIGILRKATTPYGNAKYGQIRYWSNPKTQAEIIYFFNERATDFGKTPIT